MDFVRSYSRSRDMEAQASEFRSNADPGPIIE